MQKLKKILIFSLGLFVVGNLFLCTTMAQNTAKTGGTESILENGSVKSPYDGVLGVTTDDVGLKSAINGGDLVSGKGSELFNAQVLQIISYIIDIFIVIGIAVAFFGGYKIMTSSKEDSLKDGVKLVAFGVLGIIVMVSARFLATSLVGDNGVITEQFSNATNDRQPNGIIFADDLYNTVMYPFIKIALYFVVGILFFIMAGKVIGFITATDDSVKKKAGGLIVRCVVGILIVMGSKQIVEAVMGKQESVLKRVEIINGQGAESVPTRIDEQGNSILEFGSAPLVAQIINWVMGLTMFFIMVLIIIQGYKIFTKPDDPKVREGLKKTILYIAIGIIVIGTAYIISNVLVVNKVPLITAVG